MCPNSIEKGECEFVGKGVRCKLGYHVKGTTKSGRTESDDSRSKTKDSRIKCDQVDQTEMKTSLGSIQSEIVKLKENQTLEMEKMRQEMLSMKNTRQIEPQYQNQALSKDQELVSMIKAWVARN